ncbi:MAG: energy transducer TonB [Acidobacteriota bacterium]
MKTYFASCRLVALVGCLTIVLCLGLDLKTHAQDTEPRLLSQPGFVLSEKAVAAGIDGVFNVSLSIDKTGKVKTVTLHGGPAWPCNTSPWSEIESVRDAVKKHLMSIVFAPATKNGKPYDVDVRLDFAIGEAYKRAVAIEEAEKAAAAGKLIVVKAGVVNGKAIRLTKPRYAGIRGVVTIQVLIDERGNIANAGGMSGHPFLVKSAREAACESKFSPTIIEGKPVKVTGIITYNYVP